MGIVDQDPVQDDGMGVAVPATTANLGAGFDCIGAALALYNSFAFAPLETELGAVVIRATGVDADRVVTDESNLAYQAFRRVFEVLERPVPGVLLTIRLQVPLARGLGSSATAIVGGLVGANQLAGFPLSVDEVMQLAIAMEGHPDNVVPALLGGCQLAVPQGDTWLVCPVPWLESIVPIVAIPDFELSTSAARGVLPSSYSRGDAVFNVSHFGLLVRGLQTGREDWLRLALDDRIHQPYRKSLIPGFDRLHQAALAAGAYGLVISGAGPTLLALASPTTSPAVIKALADTWQAEGMAAQVMAMPLATQGAGSVFS